MERKRDAFFTKLKEETERNLVLLEEQGNQLKKKIDSIIATRETWLTKIQRPGGEALVLLESKHFLSELANLQLPKKVKPSVGGFLYFYKFDINSLVKDMEKCELSVFEKV